MKLYWEDAPDNASFFAIPFGMGQEVLPLNATHIKHLPKPLEPMTILSQNFLPNQHAWRMLVERTLEQIRARAFDKVVLARKTTIQTKERIDPWALLSYLKTEAQNSTFFGLEDEKSAFVGATPETLFKRQKNHIFVEALAGTSPRGKTPQEDAALEQELLHHPAKQKEVALVQLFIEETLAPFCIQPPRFSPLRVKKTSHVQHLHATAEGILRPGVSDLTLAKALHPTPALCGFPKQSAFDWIASNEPFSRGLYGGVLGWSTQDASEWIVAIRSAKVEGSLMHLYTGCGIVEGSHPDTEWDELNHKIRLYRKVFTIKNDSHFTGMLA